LWFFPTGKQKICSIVTQNLTLGEQIMISGPALVINGTLLGGGFLSLFLFSISPHLTKSTDPVANMPSSASFQSAADEQSGGAQSEDHQTDSISIAPQDDCELSHRFHPPS
jgi:hypothetical protein